MFNFKRKKPELPLEYEKLLKRLHKKYPGKHISIDTKHAYYSHDNGYCAIEYSVYVEDFESHQYFRTFAKVEKHVDYLCKKGGR